MSGWVYMMSNRPDGTLYAGVTSDLPKRAWEHREGVVPGFTKRYNLHHLVWFEFHDDIKGAIQREKVLKSWPRSRKCGLIAEMNSAWSDLYDQLNR
ncbi:GIY-YIG nuclease family protein [Lacibacterium aquatile]|uniref:GIY-YIG nuclease family protein n=1 Tax=Lacibacterium aquatile TaxID=1168082 RepID=A0ABW5DVE3_9PROT